MSGSPLRRLVLGLVALVVVVVAGACSEGTRSDLDASLDDEQEDPGTTDSPATDPPATDPPATDPPRTDPPATDPPATDPPRTDPPATDPPPPSAGDRSGPVSVFDLTVGLCFDDTEGEGPLEALAEVPCAGPHDNEIFHLFDLAEGAYPGDDAVALAAEDGCIVAFGEFVGRDYATSALWLNYLTPTADSWRSGDREVVCFLFLQGEPMVGTQEGSGI